MKSKEILKRINDHEPGWIFCAQDFADLASRNTIDQTLHRLSKQGAINKVITGIYHVPRVSEKWGTIPPDPYEVLRVFVKKYDRQLQVHPAIAVCGLGLSPDVPMNIVYLTDGMSKMFKIGNLTLKLIHASSKKMLGAGTKIGYVIQALYYFGKERLHNPTFKQTKDIISKSRAFLNDDEKVALSNIMPKTPVWMQPTVRRILQDA